MHAKSGSLPSQRPSSVLAAQSVIVDNILTFAVLEVAPRAKKEGPRMAKKVRVRALDYAPQERLGSSLGQQVDAGIAHLVSGPRIEPAALLVSVAYQDRNMMAKPVDAFSALQDDILSSEDSFPHGASHAPVGPSAKEGCHSISGKAFG